MMLPAGATALVVVEGRRYGMGATMSVFNMSMSLGSAAGPLLAGWMTDAWNVMQTFLAFAVIGAAGVILFAIYSCSPAKAA